ncbi:hypothetical protein OS493_033602 [Desmophyllum pertusum]|uniref:Right handed beta helix domain-containing protein n=1 Tax=Desmophyllum pertusum TaxID=174260 RepID=A0A9X0CP59_9CNID|nr:hypothetical protein OS493_033602 [Desmophyllum pertusum]
MCAPYFSSLIIVICILASAPFLLPRAEVTTIVVSQENGAVDNNTCWNEKTVPCRTLDYALNHVTNSTFVLLRSGNYSYNLTEHFNFTNKKEIGLIGDEKTTVTVECSHNGSLSFANSENITLRRVLLRGCGGLHNSTTGDAFTNHSRMPFLSAVFLIHCKDVVVENCWIVQSPGIGLNMYDVGGDVQIVHSWFESNQPIGNPTSTNVAAAGGGVYIEFTYKGEAFQSDLYSTAFAEFDNNSRYTIYNCTFRDNRAPDQNFSTMIDNPHGDDHIPFGRGGGLSIFVKGVAKHNLIQITRCHFEDNHALWGGGLFIEFQDEVENNTLEVKHCTFTNNSAHYAGGAIRSGTCAGGDSHQFLVNQMKYEDCMFTSNSAVLGGGVSHHGTGSFVKVIDSNSLNIQFIRCQWRTNTATMGSAIGLAAQPSINGVQDLTAKGPRLIHRIALEDCNVTNNPIVLTEDKQVIGQGAIYSYSLPVIFKGVVNVEYNNNTAMVIENTAIHVFDTVTFRNNTGGQGGALGLYGTSVIMLMPQTTGRSYLCEGSGPPVVSLQTTELNTRPCFIAYNNSFSLEKVTEWQTKIVFKGNRALSSGGGNSVYASTLQGCRQEGQHRINNKSLEWHNVIQYLDSNKSPGEQISTDPVSITLNESEWEVSPSQVFNATVELIDEKNSYVLGVVNITITNSDHVTLGTASDLFLIQGDTPKINNLHLLGKEHSRFKVHASTVAGRVVQKRSKAVHLKGCYPGFVQHDNTKTCSCMEGHDAGISNCSADSKHVFLKRGYWGGTIDEEKRRNSIITLLLQEGQYLDKFISFVIGAANWRVKGVGTCLYNGMTNLQKLGVNYILPSYVLLLLIILSKLARYCPACYINRNVSRAFCTLLVLCYTNITMISCNIVHYVPIQGRWVLYADGNIDFKCYKNEYRWFAAYYFICRIYILFIALFVPFGPLKRSILEVSSVIIVVTCLYLQPYKRDSTNNEDYNWLNTLDAVLLTNLCFVAIFSSSIIREASLSVQNGLERTVNVLAYVPLAYLFCLICYHGWKYFCPVNLDYEQVEPEAGSTSESVRPAQPI